MVFLTWVAMTTALILVMALMQRLAIAAVFWFAMRENRKDD